MNHLSDIANRPSKRQKTTLVGNQVPSKDELAATEAVLEATVAAKKDGAYDAAVAATVALQAATNLIEAAKAAIALILLLY